MPKQKNDPKQRTLNNFKNYFITSVRSRVEKHVTSSHGKRKVASVYIPYRNDGKVRGRGAYFDHQTIQTISGLPTKIANVTSTQVYLTEYMSNHVTHKLAHGVDVPDSSVRCPEVVTSPENCAGLIFLPGVDRTTKESGGEVFEKRQEAYDRLIRDALLRGKPILSVCGGSWDLWTKFGGMLVDAHDHNCNLGMPRIKVSGKVGFNKQVHRVRLLDEGYIVKGAMQYQQYKDTNPNPSVNSVHWKAPDISTVPDFFNVSALSVHDEKLAPMNRQSRPMQPAEELVEAFESKHGAPIAAFQWHIEAYTNNTDAQYFPAQHQSIIKYMGEAGRTYLLKCNVIEEIKQRVKTYPINEKKPGKLIKLKPTQLLKSTQPQRELFKFHAREEEIHKKQRTHYCQDHKVKTEKKEYALK